MRFQAALGKEKVQIPVIMHADAEMGQSRDPDAAGSGDSPQTVSRRTLPAIFLCCLATTQTCLSPLFNHHFHSRKEIAS